MRWFRDAEFNDLKHMDSEFLWFLDDVRTAAGQPFVLTSDYRDAARNTAVGGAPSSLHVLGRAVDFTLSRGWTYENLFRVVWAVMHVASNIEQQLGIELELDMTNRHVHLGLFPDKRPHRFVVKV